MSVITPELLTKLAAFQTAIWQSVSIAASERANAELNFDNPLTTVAGSNDAFAEIASPHLLAQFSFADEGNSTMFLVVPEDAAMALAGVVMEGGAPDEFDESAVAEMRPVMEAMVEGLCMAVGNARNDSVVATGLQFRYGVPTPTDNFLRYDEVVQTNVGISGSGINTIIIWLADPETIASILGVEVEGAASGSQEASIESASPFESVSAPVAAPSYPSRPAAEDNSLELLMDIPLEISVELGRVKMQVRDVVELGAGSIVEIDKAAGEPVDVLVNGRLVARGEVVVIEDNFGVRITEILTTQERLPRLNEAA